VAVLGSAQLELADPGDERARVVPRTLAKSSGRPLTLAGAQRLGHLGFQQLLQDRRDQRSPEFLVLREQRLHFRQRRPQTTRLWLSEVTGSTPVARPRLSGRRQALARPWRAQVRGPSRRTKQLARWRSSSAQVARAAASVANGPIWTR
jgi:hypothetical protein